VLNYRLITILTVCFFVFAPLAANWATTPDGGWYRPYLLWLVFIFAVMLWQRHKAGNGSANR